MIRIQKLYGWLLFLLFCVIGMMIIMMQKTQADANNGVCYYQIGNIKLYSLLDGKIDVPLSNIIPDNSGFDHPYFHAGADETIQVPINIFLFDTGKQKILVDAGLGGMFHSKTGHVLEKLQQAGYQAADISAIFITHFHADHIAGLLQADGSPTFPSAALYIVQGESDELLQKSDQDSTSKLAASIMHAYTVHMVVPNQVIFQDVLVYSLLGHTNHHAGFLFNAGDQKILAWGDVLHVPVLQFAHPGVSLKFDTNQTEAIATRKAILEQAAQQNYVIAGIHLTVPGVGMVKKNSTTSDDDASYEWIALQPQC